MEKSLKEKIINNLPSEEELDAAGRKRWGQQKSDACNWWQKLLESGVKTPKTTIVKMDYDIFKDLFKPLDGLPMGELGNNFVEAVEKAVNEMGRPCFLRDSLSSDKHSWDKTCFITDESNIKHNIVGLLEHSAMCPYGFPTLFMVREMIDTFHEFYAFYGNMPITKERRYFVNDGKVVCHHPYWPEEAIENNTKKENWQAALSRMNVETWPEVEYLTEQTEKVGRHFDGWWSIDWLQDRHGDWWCIDMAEGGISYHWPGCKTIK